jgi:vitamin B12 transporter
MKKLYPSYLLVVILFICVSGLSTFAQIDTVNTIKEVRVISSKNLPASIPSQEIRSKDFKKFSAFNVADAIRNFSGVNIKDYGGIGGLKTVTVRSLSANHTAILFDGIIVNDAQNGQIDLGKISLDNIESITLFNAQPNDLPQSARPYAAASVIAIQSGQPSFDSLKHYKLSAQMTTGSFGLINPSIQWQQKIDKLWSYKINSSWQKANGIYKYRLDGDGSDTLAVRNNADVEVFQLDVSLYGSFSKSNKLHLRANYYESERGLPGAVISYNPLSSQRLWNRDVFIQATFQQQFNDKLKLKISSKAVQNYTRYIDPQFLNLQNGLDQKYTQNEIYQSAAVSYQLNKTFGINYAADIAVTELETNLPQYAYPTRYSLLQVIGGNLNFEKWKASANVLNTLISEKVKVGPSSPSRSVYTPAFLVSYQPYENSDLLFRAFYKEIFRYPTFSDLYYTNYGNRSLEPEFIKQVNIGSTFSKILNGRLSHVSFTTDAYFNKVKDKIVATPNRDLFLWTVRNIGEVAIYGIDAGAATQYQLSKIWKADFAVNYTYQSALDVSNPQSSVYRHQIPYTPKHTLSANLGFSKENFGIYYNHLFSSGRYYLSENSPEYFVPGFSISDISATQTFKLFNYVCSSSVEINNLFNKSYSLIRSFPMPGTSFRLSLKTTI